MPEDSHPINIDIHSIPRSHGAPENYDLLEKEDPFARKRRELRAKLEAGPPPIKDLFHDGYNVGQRIFESRNLYRLSVESKESFKQALIEGIELGMRHAEEKWIEQEKLI